MTKDPIVEALQNTAMLVAVRMKAFTLSRTDKTASAEVEGDKHAVQGTARVVVSRLAGADEHHKAIVAIQNQIKADVIGVSMPFNNEDIWRMLPNANFDPLLVKLAAGNQAFIAARRELEANVDAILHKASINLAGFNVQLPTRDDLVNAYSIDVDFRPMPDTQFKGLPNGASERLQQAFEARLRNAVDDAQRDTLERVLRPLENVVDRLTAYDQREDGKGKAGTFKDTLVGNCRDIWEVLGSLNIGGDPRIAELVNRLEPIATVTPKALRKDAAVRADTLHAAKAIVDDLNDWLSPLTPGVA